MDRYLTVLGSPVRLRETRENVEKFVGTGDGRVLVDDPCVDGVFYRDVSNHAQYLEGQIVQAGRSRDFDGVLLTKEEGNNERHAALGTERAGAEHGRVSADPRGRR